MVQDEFKQWLAAAQAETRRHFEETAERFSAETRRLFDVAMESTKGEIRLVAESVASVGEELKETRTSLGLEIERTAAETQATRT
ncbi:MAG TPA: hypothetical protein VMS56_07185 [Thermoanaerobaculia bacterium]|nr:hypothetical protein [Thermoanaerobaculia bacterium]